jgi:hypothetical protein
MRGTGASPLTFETLSIWIASSHSDAVKYLVNLTPGASDRPATAWRCRTPPSPGCVEPIFDAILFLLHLDSASPTLMNSINYMRPMSHRDRESASAAGKKFRRMGSAFFGDNLDRFRQDSLAVRIRDDKKLEAVALCRVAHLNFAARS